MKDQEFRDWATQQCIPVFYGSAFLIVLFVNAFHWIMPLISGGIADSLPTRLWASLPAVVLTALVFFRPHFKKYIIEFQTIQIAGMVIGCIWVTGLAQFHPYYLTASLLGIVGAALTLITMAQVWGVFLIAAVAILIFYFVEDHSNSFFPFLYYYSFLIISCLLAWIKVRAHAQEFKLRKSLNLAIEDLKLEKSKIFVHEQLSFVGELAGNLAHEVNNPLTIFQTSLQILRGKLQDSSLLDEDSLQLLKRCFEQTDRMKSLVENMLYFSGKHFKAENRQSAKQLVESAVSLVKSYAHQKKVRVELKIEIDAFLECSNRDILQVLFHILKNAIEAASYSKQTKELATDSWVIISSSLTHNRKSYEIDIIDSGEGISPEVKRKIFTPFVVGKEKKGHIGLGLSTSKSIIERCAGHIEYIDNQKNTTFRLTVPIQSFS